MIAFRNVPLGVGGTIQRPLLDVFLDTARHIPQTCLVDTGAAGVRLSADLGRAAGLDLPAAPNRADVIVGAVRSQIYAVVMTLTIELDDRPVSWEADVTFCDPWPHPFGLLGMHGFLDAFDILLCGRDRTFDVLVEPSGERQ